jgi:nucleotide-binding universal stress UspA family protein
MTSVLSPLAATDLSPPARHAAQRAALLARQSGGRLALVHVQEKDALGELRHLLGQSSAAMESRLRAQTQDALAEMARELSAPDGLNVTTHLVEGAVLTTILAQAQAVNANLLVVGARGASFMRHWLLGATAERLLRKTRLPILVVKQPPHQAYQRVLVSVDFSDWSAQAVRLAQTLAPQAQLVLIHACELPFEGKMRYAGIDEETIVHHRTTQQREALELLHDLARETELTLPAWRPLVIHGNASDCILEQEKKLAADLIVLGKHGRGMTEELLLGSVTKHVLSQASADVLVVTQPDTL